MNFQFVVPVAGLNVMSMSPANIHGGARLPYLSTLPGQPSMETMQPVPPTNTQPMSAPYAHGIHITSSARTTALHNNLATLAETIAQATSLIQAAGLGQGFSYALIFKQC